MITLTPISSFLMPDEFLSTKRTVESIDLKIQDATSCSNFSECFDCSLPAFANLALPSDTLTNDFSSFMVQYGNNTTVVATLLNKTTGTEYIITDNTYGILYDATQIGTNNFGFKLLWYNVANLIGFGKYEFNIVLSHTVSGNEFYTEQRR